MHKATTPYCSCSQGRLNKREVRYESLKHTRAPYYGALMAQCINGPLMHWSLKNSVHGMTGARSCFKLLNQSIMMQSRHCELNSAAPRFDARMARCNQNRLINYYLINTHAEIFHALKRLCNNISRLA